MDFFEFAYEETLPGIGLAGDSKPKPRSDRSKTTRNTKKDQSPDESNHCQGTSPGHNEDFRINRPRVAEGVKWISEYFIQHFPSSLYQLTIMIKPISVYEKEVLS